MKYTTRIAPSPTGDMHIGTARTAYYNWLAARGSGGRFILRIDDTDAARSKDEYTQGIIETMAWLGLDYDAIEYQSKRYERYRELAGQWLDKGLAIKDASGAVRFWLPPDGPTTWEDNGKPMKVTADDRNKTNDIVLMRADDTPTYNWASVIDDMDMGVNLIIRGVDHITNTSKQVLLWSCLGHPLPKFVHVGLIGQKGKPFSKREGAASMLYYREKGYDVDAVLNFLARLGWGPKNDDKTTALLPKERMVELFLTGGNFRTNLADCDLGKLESYDRKYKARKGVWRTGEKLIEESKDDSRDGRTEDV